MRIISFLVLYSFINIVDCIIPLNVLLSVIDQFKLIDVRIQNNCFTATEKRQLFKIFSDNGKAVNFEKIFHQHHSIIICTENIGHLTKQTQSPVVVVYEDSSKDFLNKIKISLGEMVYFLNKDTFKIYEAYEVNDVHVTRFLGQFHQTCKNSASFSPADGFIDSFVDRRGNFYGIQLIAMTEQWGTDIILPNNFKDKSYFFPTNETYDVTNIVSGVYIDVLKHLEKFLNFSTKLYKRKDGVWGMPKTLSNGTVTHLDGMLKSLVEYPVDLICAPFSSIPARFYIVDFLKTITREHAALYIANTNLNDKKYETFDWKVYLSPFSLKLWLFMFGFAIAFMIIISIIEWQYNIKMVNFHYYVRNALIS